MLVGKLLQEKRLEKKISITKVSEELRISISQIQTIESDTYMDSIGDAYYIGFIKQYAVFLDLDSNEIINQFKKQISHIKSTENIELPKPMDAFSPFVSFRLISFLGIFVISLTFYYMFISNNKLSTEYAIISDVPEDLNSEIEEYEVKMALKEIKNIEDNSLQDDFFTNELINNNASKVIANTPKSTDLNGINTIVSLTAINSTWLQLRNNEMEIIFSKLMKKNETHTYTLEDELFITTGNAGNILVSIGDEVLGKLGKKGEVLDSVILTQDFFSN